VLQRNLGGDAAGPGVLQRNLGGLVEFGSGLEGTPYVWGGVNPSGVDCSGYTSALAAKALGQHPWQRRHTTSTIDSDPAFARGLQSGFEVGVSTAGQLGGIGHMGATVGGVGMEATPPEVRVGPEARGATHSLFRQRYGFRGLAGEQGALSDPKGDASNIPFWARPVLDAIADALSGAFGLPEEGWADGAVHDRPWRGIANVGERETELTTPVSLLDDRIDAGLARHDGAGRQPVVIQEGAIQVRDSGSPRDTADAVLAELEDRLAW
jgi:cell wall-associated NlpC family hydrolase